MKLTEVQKHIINQAYSDTLKILNQIKLRRLRKRDVIHMKMLEDAVTNLETFTMVAFKE